LLNGLGKFIMILFIIMFQNSLVCFICNHHRLLPTSPCKHAHFSCVCYG
jgi:hypothetical protein